MGIFLDIACVQRRIRSVNPFIVIVDDGLYSRIEHPRKIPESRVRERHRRRLRDLADTLANYFRELAEENPKKFREELRRFEK